MTNVRISMVMPVDMLEAVDETRGDVPRSVWIRKLISSKINKGGKQKNG